jgi:hypothetical protein
MRWRPSFPVARLAIPRSPPSPARRRAPRGRTFAPDRADHGVDHARPRPGPDRSSSFPRTQSTYPSSTSVQTPHQHVDADYCLSPLLPAPASAAPPRAHLLAHSATPPRHSATPHSACHVRLISGAHGELCGPQAHFVNKKSTCGQRRVEVVRRATDNGVRALQTEGKVHGNMDHHHECDRIAQKLFVGGYFFGGQATK